MSHSGLLFKLKSLGVGGSVLSICREFLSNRKKRAVVDDVTSEWIKIVPGVPQGSVLGPLIFIFYTGEMFELMKNRLCAYANDSTLLEVVRKPADRPDVCASPNLDILGLKFDSRLTFEDHVRSSMVVLSPVSLKELVF